MSVVRLAVDSGLFVLIWMVQLIIYPSFHVIDRDRFIPWHAHYSVLIAIIVGPLMLLQLGLELYLAAAGYPAPQRLLIISLIWIATVALSIPCHRKLHLYGHDRTTINRLIRTNWIRTILWTALLADCVRILLD